MIFPEKYFDREIYFATSRSGGKGGQHVNKVETKVELNFDVVNSGLISEDQKKIILRKLKNHISSEGILKVVSQSQRSQLMNKKRAADRFYELIENSLKEKKIRKKTKVPSSAKNKRLRTKKNISGKKSLRRIDMGKEIY